MTAFEKENHLLLQYALACGCRHLLVMIAYYAIAVFHFPNPVSILRSRGWTSEAMVYFMAIYSGMILLGLATKLGLLFSVGASISGPRKLIPAAITISFYLFALGTTPLAIVLMASRLPLLLSSAYWRASHWFWCALSNRDRAAAEQALAALGDNPRWADNALQFNRQFGEGLLARAIHDDARARQAFTAARVEQEQLVQKQKDYGPPLCVLGLIDAALGNKEAALQEGRRAMELLPREKDSVNGEALFSNFAVIAAWAGEKDLALQQLKDAILLPGATNITSYGMLKLWPFWDPLRGDPRFEKIVASLATKSADK